MNVQKVQSNQTNFGTIVLLKPRTKELLKHSPAKRKFQNHIKKLETNGKDDVFVISHFERGKSYIPRLVEELRGVVYEKSDDKIVRTPYGVVSSLVDEYWNYSKNKYANLLNMYKDAKNNYTMREISKADYEKQTANLERFI